MLKLFILCSLVTSSLDTVFYDLLIGSENDALTVKHFISLSEEYKDFLASIGGQTVDDSVRTSLISTFHSFRVAPCMKGALPQALQSRYDEFFENESPLEVFPGEGDAIWRFKWPGEKYRFTRRDMMDMNAGRYAKLGANGSCKTLYFDFVRKCQVEARMKRAEVGYQSISYSAFFQFAPGHRLLALQSGLFVDLYQDRKLFPVRLYSDGGLRLIDIHVGANDVALQMTNEYEKGAQGVFNLRADYVKIETARQPQIMVALSDLSRPFVYSLENGEFLHMRVLKKPTVAQMDKIILSRLPNGHNWSTAPPISMEYPLMPAQYGQPMPTHGLIVKRLV